MNPSGSEGWHSSAGGGPPSHPNMEQSRPLGSYGQNPSQQTFSSQPAGPVLPSPAGPYHSVNQSSGHSLPGLADLAQGPGGPHQPPPYGQHAQPTHGGHSLPGIGQAMQHPSPQLNRDRERDSREREMLERQRHEDMVHREREQREREREHLERQQREQHTVQSHTGSIPIHQPVASKVPNSIHGPNGLLSNIGGGGGGAAANPPQSSIQSGGPTSLFGVQIPSSHQDNPPRPYIQHPQAPPSQQSMMSYNGAAPAQIPGNVAALAQGQQPILNDALSYLDQVKVRFHEQPDVYNRFLDIMKDFKSQAIDTPGVIQRVSNLFTGHPALIQGFNTFLPPGYRIECGTDDNPNAIRVTTPSGTNTLSMAARPSRPSLDSPEEIGQASGSLAPPGRPDYYDHSRAGWQQSQHSSQAGIAGSYSPNSRVMGTSSLYGQQGGQPQAQEHHYEYQNQQEPQAFPASAAALQQQEQRGVSQLQNAAASSAAAGRGSILQPTTGTASGPGPMNSLAGIGSGVLQGSQTDLNKRGPVEFNHAISYVNKIKNRFASAPEIYKQFLEILQTYQRESKPIQDVYAQVTQLFHTAPDLLEDFKQFLPDSASQGKQQAQAGRASVDEAAPTSNLRGEPPYPASAQSQMPGRDVKMPPLGQFNVKESNKETKKRRGGPISNNALGAPVIGPVSEASRVGDIQSNRAGSVQAPGMNKRAKIHHNKPMQADGPAVSPTLVPALPEPIPPTFSIMPNNDEFAFFDRVKKFIGNKQTFGEFLKLCNLYSTDLIDRNVLVKHAD